MKTATPSQEDPDAAAQARRRLLELRMRKRAGDLAATTVPIERLPGDVAPVSYAQASLWFLDRLTGPSGVYNVGRVLRIRGPLDVPRLQRSLACLLVRHPALRTAIDQAADRDEASQRVMDAEQALARFNCAIEPVDGAGDEPLQARAGQLLAEPFDLADGLLWRARLLRVAAHDHLLVLAVHHIVSDAWSMGVLLRELGDIYSAGGSDDALAPLPIRFIDYVAWQRERQSGDNARAHLDYWRDRLAGLETLELPTDHPRPARPSFRGGTVAFQVPAAVLDSLKALARSDNATLFMVLAAALQVLLGRYSRQADFAIGFPVAGRQRTETENLVGYFVNTLVLRADLAGDPPFAELLARTRKHVLDALAHQDMPFDRLVAELSPQRDLSRNPLYQVSFALYNTAPERCGLDGLDCEPMPADAGHARFDLTLGLVERDGGLAGTLEFSRDLFDASTAQRLAAHYRMLLTAIVSAPQTPVSALPLLGDDERALQLTDWNNTARDWPLDSDLSAHLQARMTDAPQAVAVIYEGRTIANRQLADQVAGWAARLARLGVGAGSLVGIHLPRTPQMLVAVLAVLRTGAAYLPLDPDFPPGRVEFMLRDSRVGLVLTDSSVSDRLPATSARLVRMDAGVDDAMADDAALQPVPPDERLLALAEDELPAYVLYTSGSTGEPKGVLVPRRAVLNFLYSMREQPGLAAGDCLLAVTTLSFDIAVLELMLPLLTGATLVLATRDEALDGRALRRLIDRHAVTMMQATPTTWRLLVDSGWGEQPGFRALVGGEALPPSLAEELLRRCAQVWNMYGPTETTVWSTCWRVAPGRVSIGRPIGNTVVRVLDGNRQLCPVGVPGELLIGGAGLATGYLGRDQLTAERFVADPCQDGARLYRTGDLVRWLADGTLEFVGRVDHQVKLRGYRIETSEIEARLLGLPAIRQCAVIVREDSPGDQRLVAYLVSDPQSPAPAAPDLLAALGQFLPAYMLPSAFVMLAALPQTPNGKLDRKALPPPVALRRPGDDAPEDMNPLERDLTSIWESTLETSPIRLDDDFFVLGGHSLKAIRLLAQIEKQTGVVLRLASIFQAPTVRKLAALIQLHKSAPVSCVVAVQPQGTRPALFVVSGWGGSLLVFNDLARELGKDQPLYVLDTGAFGLDDAEGEVTLTSVARRMIADMRAIQRHGPYRLAGYSLGGKVIYEIARQLREEGETVPLLVLLDCNAPGYPRMQNFAVRTLAHVRHALSLGPVHTINYLGQRVMKLKKYFVKIQPRLFEQAPGTGIESSEVLKQMERSAARVYGAWQGYVPSVFPGRPVLVRATKKPVQPGRPDDDPMMGWGPYAAQGVEVEPIGSMHHDLLFPEHSAELAALLTRHLDRYLNAA